MTRRFFLLLIIMSISPKIAFGIDFYLKNGKVVSGDIWSVTGDTVKLVASPASFVRPFEIIPRDEIAAFKEKIRKKHLNELLYPVRYFTEKVFYMRTMDLDWYRAALGRHL